MAKKIKRKIKTGKSSGKRKFIRKNRAVISRKKKPVKKIKKNSKNNYGSKFRYVLNPDFEFFEELRSLILKSSPSEKDRMIKKISGLGRIRLAVISGIFLGEGIDTGGSVTDLLVVGEDINRERLRSFLRGLEAEIGREVRFSLMDKEEFEYRYGMFDRFVRVLLEGPHEKIINKIGI